MMHRITDWADAYANGVNIPQGHNWPAAWVEPARAFRAALADEGRALLDLAYGKGARQRLDLFRPATQDVRGLVVFVHGGYWVKLDKSYWSHLAGGALAHGFAVAIPSYTLCPEARVRDIVRDIANAVEAASTHVQGTLHLAGHSAGGHLVTRMASSDSPLTQGTRSRLSSVVSISGLHDLRPLLATDLNEEIGLDQEEARAESPALLEPLPDLRLTCWVGGGERSEFLRQSALLANVWKGLGAATECVEEPDRHHFNVIDGLADPDHALTRAVIGA